MTANNFQNISAFRWGEKQEAAAFALAQGKTQEAAAEIAGVTDRTIRNWLAHSEFVEEVDRLTFLTGIAHKAERLRLAKRVIANLSITTEKDLLDWLKYAQSETSGIKLDFTELLTAITENDKEMAGSRPRSIGSEIESIDGDSTTNALATDRSAEVQE